MLDPIEEPLDRNLCFLGFIWLFDLLLSFR